MNIKPAPAPAPKPPVACAWGACPNMVTRGEEYSFILTLATRGAEARAGAFQCPDTDEIAAGNLDAQHFCCSMACAALCAHACIDEHLVPRHQDHLAQLAQYDADLAAERAAFAAHQADLAQPASTPALPDEVAPVDTPTLTMPIITDSTPEPEPASATELSPDPTIVTPDAHEESDHDDPATEPESEPTSATSDAPANEELPESADDASGTEAGTLAGDSPDHDAG